MRAGSTLLLSRMAGATRFHGADVGAAAQHELLHPKHLNRLVEHLDLRDETLRARGPLAVFEATWAALGPCPVKLMPQHFFLACWRFGCTEPPGVLFARWIRDVDADLVLLRRHDKLAQVASAVRAEVEENFNGSARSADGVLNWDDEMSDRIWRAAERIGLDDCLLSSMPGLRLYYESLCESGFTHRALPGTETTPLSRLRDWADADRSFGPTDQRAFSARARAGLAAGRLRAHREVLDHLDHITAFV